VGFFAVAPLQDDPDFDLIALHLNLWVLGGLFGYRAVYLDVGLRLRPNEEQLGRFRLGLPIGTRDDSLVSLRDVMTDPVVASLIFARENVIVGDHQLNLDGQRIPLLRLDSANSMREARGNHHDFSIWTIALAEPLEIGAEGYVRLRFKIKSLGRLWLWHRSLAARTAATADIRVADEREAQTVQYTETLTSRMVQADRIDAFIIAPEVFQPRLTSPDPAYVRLLEGRVWEKYLHRATDIFRNEKFLVYRWRENNVSSGNPFRGLVQMSRERSLLPRMSELMPALIALVLAGFVFDLDFRDLSWIESAAGDVLAFVFGGIGKTVVSLLGLTVVIGAVYLLRNLIRDLRRSFGGVLGRIDEWVYSRRGTNAR